MNYWRRKSEMSEIARNHTKEMEKKYAYDIERCYHKSLVFGPDDIDNKDCVAGVQGFDIFLVKADVVSTIFQQMSGNRVVVLNFASYKEPGGRFLDGSSAQEECLCHSSYLYNVLLRESKYYRWNQDNLNRGLYKNRSILSPLVKFFHDGYEMEADVLTCAAPNKSCIKYGLFDEDENRKVLRSRIEFISSILRRKEYNPDVVILGAFGCGVFQQDAEDVARIFRTVRYPESARVIYAVPDEENYRKSYKVFHPYP